LGGGRLAAVLVALALAGCGLNPFGGNDPPQTGGTTAGTAVTPAGSDTGSALGGEVNGFVWRASLDTVRFMQLASVDADRGQIVTNWYIPPAAPKERMRVVINITNRDLTPDAVHVEVFHQIRLDNNEWSDAVVSPVMHTNLESAILTRALFLRRAASDQ